MATITEIPAVGTANQVVGKVVILYGSVKAVAPDGAERLLVPNSPIFANDHIVTESDGNVSIMFDGTPPTQMDLGRMSNVVIDEDVYAGMAPSVVSDVAAEAEQIQKALMAGDQPIDLAAPAAGGDTGAGGAHPLFVLNATGAEVTPTSGAETTGVTFGVPGTLDAVFAQPALVSPVVSIGTDIHVGTGPDIHAGSAIEGSPVTFGVYQDVVSNHDTTVTVQVVGAPGDTATPGADFTPITTLNVIIPAGQLGATFNVNTLPDQLQEGPETFTAHIVSAANPNGAVTVGIADAVGTILDAYTPPVISIGSGGGIAGGSATEGSPVTFTIHQDVVSDHDTTVTVQVVGAPGDTATPGADYTPITTLDVVIHAGQTSATFDVSTLIDQLQEGNETFTAQIVSASNPNGAVTVGTADAVGTILDAYTPPVISIGAGGGIAGGSATEGSPVTFTIHQDTASDHDTTVTVQVVGAPLDTSTPGADYTPITTLDVVIHAGQASATFDVSTLTDQLQEGPETFTQHIVSAVNANGAVTVGAADAIGTIVDAYTPPVISIDGGITGGSATEGNPVTFTIHQSTVSDHDTTVTVQVVGAPLDTATPGADYTPITTLDVVILAGQQSATFNVNTLTDQLQEPNLIFTAHIVSAANANGAVTVGTADAQGTILDVYTPPVISIDGGITGGSATEGNPVTFTIHQSTVSDHDTTVTVQVLGAAGDSATPGADYTPITTLDVVIHAGQTSATFDVSTLTDQLQEGTEAFTAHIVSAANPNGAVTVGTADAVGTILDAYTPPVISIGAGGGISGGSATEGSPVTFTIHQDSASDHDTTVTVQVVGAPLDTATPGADYTPITTLDVVIHAGQASATFDVSTLTDQLQEGPETFTAHIVSAVNANGAVTVGAADAIGTIVDAYTPPVISIDGGITGGSATEGNPVTFTIHQSTVSDHDTTVTVQVVGASGDTATPTLDYTTITTLDVVIH